ncbi:MAG: fatty acid desaturase [Proteobacteria bacterium]|nr:fatty acid desaturase [Pseudomonadota bacterium]
MNQTAIMPGRDSATGGDSDTSGGDSAKGGGKDTGEFPQLDERNFRHRLSEHTLQQIRALHTVRPWHSVLTYVGVYLAIAAAFALDALANHPVITGLAIIFIAGRQHSLYIINHDASHHSLFRSRRTNKFFGTLFSNLVMFHHPEAWSYIQWRRVHLLHHKYLFTDRDPNYVGRRMKGDTTRNYTPAQLVWACAKAGITSITQFFVSRQDYVPAKSNQAIKGKHNHVRALFLPFRDDPEMETERRIKLVFFAVALAVVAYFDLWRPFLLLWILPMYTVYPMILTLMDLTEHRWDEPKGDLNRNTRSTNVGVAGRLLISTLPRTLHREHHIFPRVVARRLPQLSRLVCGAGLAMPPAGDGLTGILRELAETARSP